MEVDPSLKETSVSKAEDGQISRPTQPKPSEDCAAVSSDYLPGRNQLSLTAVSNSVTCNTDNESLQRVETICKIKSEDSPCSAVTAGSQLSINEEHANQIVRKPQCNAGHVELKANDGVGRGSESLQQVMIPGNNNSVYHQSEVNVTLQTPQTCSETGQERTVEEIQDASSPVVTAEDQNGCDGPVSESSCTEINGGPSGDSSDEEEFLGLKRKVRGIFLKPPDLFRATSNKPQSNEKLESVAQDQETKNEAINEHIQPETEKDDCCVKGDDIATVMCKPVFTEGKVGVDVEQDTGTAKTYKHESENSDACNQQKECVLSGSFSPNAENMDDGLKEHGAKPVNPSVKSQGICPSPSANTPTLSSLDKNLNLPLTDFACRNTLTSTPSPESIGRFLSEMGPPLPPVVLPLSATPPKRRKHLTPNRPSIQLPTWSSSAEGPFSLKQQLNVPSPDPGLQDEVKSSLTLTTPSPSRGVPSSPLQFGSATPKHALPVPGRLPSSALKSSSPSASQENSMQMLDTMYPELSAQARTLNILRGNVNLGRAANEKRVSPPSVNPISGNKTINTSSTAFTKTDQTAKRIGANVLLPKSAKRLRLDTCSPDPSSLTATVQHVSDEKPNNGLASPKCCPTNGLSNSSEMAGIEGKTVDNENNAQSFISRALGKLHNLCFDVLPVIRSHVFLGRISEVPVLRDEEKSIISDFCINQVNKFKCVFNSSWVVESY